MGDIDTFDLPATRPGVGGLAIRNKRLLTPEENRCATMRAGGASSVVIATVLGCSEDTVRSILNRPAVARMVLLLNGLIGQGLEDGIRDLNKAFEVASGEAFLIERNVMHELYELGDELVGQDNDAAIKAKLGAVSTAQDILARAGKTAPTRVVQVKGHGEIGGPALDRVADVLDQMGVGVRQVEVTVTETK